MGPEVKEGGAAGRRLSQLKASASRRILEPPCGAVQGLAFEPETLEGWF